MGRHAKLTDGILLYGGRKIGFKKPIRDGRRLDLFNRKERLAYRARFGGDETMKVNLLTPVESINHDGTIIKNEEGGIPTLKKIILYALRAPHNSDAHTGFKEKNDRYLVVKRVDQCDELELTDGEVKMILDRVGKMYMQVEIVGRVAELLSKPAAATENVDGRA
jgi:hypothetical protein